MISALIPELDDLAKQIGIPAIRGIKSIGAKKAGADMGDGVLGVQPATMDYYAARVGGRPPVDVAAVAAERAKIRFELEDLRSQWRRATSEDRPALQTAMEKLRARDEPLYLQLKNVGVSEPASKWKPGDDPALQPNGGQAYFGDGVDRARQLLFHEFGHHVHQNLAKLGPRKVAGRPPLEVDLKKRWDQVTLQRKRRQLSTYSLKNEHEWFAENFSAFVMGRKDLVDPELLDIIERIFRGKYP